MMHKTSKTMQFTIDTHLV